MTTPSRSQITTAVLSEVLPTLSLGDNILLVDDDAEMFSTIFSRLQKTTMWNRRYQTQGTAAHAWPPRRNYSAAIIRLPKSHGAFDMILHAVSSVTQAHAPLIIYGMTDEGIKSAKKKLHSFFGTADTLLFKKRCHVLATRNTPQHTIKLRLADFTQTTLLSYGTKKYPTIFYPGMFAATTLDPGTALLLDASLPHITENMRVLDYGCGSGIITRVLQEHVSPLACTLLDNDSIALAAAEKNCPHTQTILSDSLQPLAEHSFDLIISNPPMHTEKTEHTTIIEDLIAHAPTYLSDNGQLIIVVQSRLNLTPLFEKYFSQHNILAQTSQYTVWHGKK